MAISGPLDDVLYVGTATSALVPQPYDVAIDGRPYIVDSSFAPFRRDAWRHRSIPLLRTQANTADAPNESSINPDGLWRRSQDSWHHGAGQTFLDRKLSDIEQFRSSKGVDVWTHWQATLLHDTALKLGSANTNLHMAVVGDHLYLCDGSHVWFTTDLTTFTAVSGLGVDTPTSITSDGFNVWIAQGTSGVFTTTRGATSASWLVESALASDSVIGYVKSRLMLSKGPSLYNITSATPAVLPTALFVHPNTDFVWTGFAEGPGQIYAAGFSGDKSLIYRTAVVADGTTLNIPVVAGELPKGEIVRSVQGYLGFLLIGSDKGVRLATSDSAGNLTIGALIPTPGAVYCFEGQDRFVWFGWSNYDTSSSGLGRIDLTVFTSADTPAYASDLMAPVRGSVQSAVTFNGLRVFSVSGIGVYAETATYVTSATLDTGLITYDVTDAKAPVFVDLLFDPPAAGTQIAVSMALNSGPFNLVGATSAGSSGQQEFATSNTQCNVLELRFTLSGDGSATPVLHRHTTRALIAAAATTELLVPIRLDPSILVGDKQEPVKASVELAFLEALRQQRRIVTYQEGGSVYQVTLEAIDWLPQQFCGADKAEMSGVAVVTFHSLN